MDALATLADVWLERYTARRHQHLWGVLDTTTQRFVEFEEFATEDGARRAATRMNAQHSAARHILAQRAP
jgi:hypothetical protein